MSDGLSEDRSPVEIRVSVQFRRRDQRSRGARAVAQGGLVGDEKALKVELERNSRRGVCKLERKAVEL